MTHLLHLLAHITSNQSVDPADYARTVTDLLTALTHSWVRMAWAMIDVVPVAPQV